MRDFLRCQKRSLLTWEAKTKTKTPPRAQTWLNVSAAYRSEARKLEDIPRHELCRCNSLSFYVAEIRKEVGDEYEPDSGKENARFKKL